MPDDDKKKPVPLTPKDSKGQQRANITVTLKKGQRLAPGQRHKGASEDEAKFGPGSSSLEDDPIYVFKKGIPVYDLGRELLSAEAKTYGDITLWKVPTYAEIHDSTWQQLYFKNMYLKLLGGSAVSQSTPDLTQFYKSTGGQANREALAFESQDLYVDITSVANNDEVTTVVLGKKDKRPFIDLIDTTDAPNADKIWKAKGLSVNVRGKALAAKGVSYFYDFNTDDLDHYKITDLPSFAADEVPVRLGGLSSVYLVPMINLYSYSYQYRILTGPGGPPVLGPVAFWPRYEDLFPFMHESHRDGYASPGVEPGGHLITGEWHLTGLGWTEDAVLNESWPTANNPQFVWPSNARWCYTGGSWSNTPPGLMAIGDPTKELKDGPVYMHSYHVSNGSLQLDIIMHGIGPGGSDVPLSLAATPRFANSVAYWNITPAVYHLQGFSLGLSPFFLGASVGAPGDGPAHTGGYCIDLNFGAANPPSHPTEMNGTFTILVDTFQSYITNNGPGFPVLETATGLLYDVLPVRKPPLAVVYRGRAYEDLPQAEKDLLMARFLTRAGNSLATNEAADFADFELHEHFEWPRPFTRSTIRDQGMLSIGKSAGPIAGQLVGVLKSGSSLQYIWVKEPATYRFGTFIEFPAAAPGIVTGRIEDGSRTV